MKQESLTRQIALGIVVPPWLQRFSKQFKVLTSRDRFDIPPRQLEGDALPLLSRKRF